MKNRLALLCSVLFVVLALWSIPSNSDNSRNTVRTLRPTSAPITNDLETLYQWADANRDDWLSWDELGRFQNYLVTHYSYQTNYVATDPVQFMLQGGGDCEDWSIMTCGLLKYYQIDSYVGIIDGSDGSYSGHAVALMRQTEVPLGCYTYFYLTYEIDYVPTGYYIPIDYDYIGCFSPSARRGTPLREIHIAETLYGRRM